MPEWLREDGIGEFRAALVEAGEIVEARVSLDGITRVGSRLPAKLKAKGPPTIAEADGQEYLLSRGAPGVTEGAELVIEITREAIPGAEPWKRPMARVTQEPPQPAPSLDAKLVEFPAATDVLGAAGWPDVLEQARSGVVQFAGGELRISPTPAMTLIDVDGYLEPAELAVRGAAEAAKAIRRLDIGGSIGIDLPTPRSKAVRNQAAAAIDAILAPPFERTAMNGFGFVQIVRPRQRASLVELAQDRAAFEARALLRHAALESAGARRLVAHPAVLAVLENQPGWLDALSRQIGGAVSLRPEPKLPMSGGYAEPA